MDFVHRMMNRNSQDFKEEVPSQTVESIPMVDVHHLDPILMRWKRLIRMMGVAYEHALTGSMLSFLEDMRNEHAEEALKEYQRVAGTAALKNLKATKSSSVPALTPLAKGKPLSRSKANKGKPYPVDPANCLHPQKEMSHPRGGPGDSAWMTCLACGSRWERLAQQYLPSHAQASGLMDHQREFSHMVQVPNPMIQNPEAVFTERKELLIQDLIKDQNTDEFKQLKATYLNLQASGMLTPVECVEQMIRGCATEMEMIAVNTFARIHVRNFE